MTRCLTGANDRPYSASLRDFVKKIRRKLGDDPADPACVLDERGVGYLVPAMSAKTGEAPP